MNHAMPGGYAGRILRVDLTARRTWAEPVDPTMLRAWIGGTGLGAKILYDEVPAEVSWDHPENRLILATGPLAGLPIWGSGALSVVTRGALNNGATSTHALGFFGANLKSSGYDAIVFQGQADGWVYLFIQDDDVEIRDATHLLGKDTWELQDALLVECGFAGHQMSVYGIGPAGERLVRFAMIAGDYGHVASKNGCGAVMGKKRVKAVAIARGSHGLKVPDPHGLFQVADEIAHSLRTDPTTRGTYENGTMNGTLALEKIGALPIRNYTTNVYPDPSPVEQFEAPTVRRRFAHRGHQCVACGMHHCHMHVIPDGPHKGEIVDEPEYEGWAGAGMTIGCTDPVAISWLNTQIDRAGVDVNEFGWLCGWVMECQEKGYLTAEECGLAVPWGNAEAAERLLQLIARREGFGNILAEGVKRAAEHVGGPAYNCAIFTHKGHTPRSHDHRGRWEEFLDTCVASTGTLEVIPIAFPTELGIPARRNPFDPGEVAGALGRALGRRDFEESLGTCIITTRTSLEHVVRALSTATGWNFTFDEALTVGRRIAATLRAFNLRCGIGPESEIPSPRYGATPTDGPNAGIGVAPHWQMMRETYYRTIGYDPATTRPLPETLRALGLEQLIPSLWGL